MCKMKAQCKIKKQKSNRLTCQFIEGKAKSNINHFSQPDTKLSITFAQTIFNVQLKTL